MKLHLHARPTRRRSSISARAARRHHSLEVLEARIAPAGLTSFTDPHPSAGDGFGSTVVVLKTGNVVITAPQDDTGGTDAGAVYLFNGVTGALISELHGSHTGDQVGGYGVTALSNGNYVVSSESWSLDAGHTAVGAVTFGNGTTGVQGIVSSANSLVGSTANDRVGSYGVTALGNGNYVVISQSWSLDGSHPGVGAVTFGNGTTGVQGVVSSANSLIGSTSDDRVGNYGLTALSNGNYVVISPSWSLDGSHTGVGAVTFGNGTSACRES